MSDNEPLVSVIMNCYNGEKYLREAVDSVYAQTYPNWEIVFLDNASVDSSKEIATSYDEKLKYYRAEINTPLGEARNLALSKAKGKYIAFLDCDDLYCKDKLSKQVRMMENENFVMSYGSVEIIDNKGRLIRSLNMRNNSGNIFESLLKKYEINMQTVMLNRSLLGYDWCIFNVLLTYSPDYNLFMKIASKFPVGVINDVLAKYRVFDGSLSTTKLGVVASEMKITLDEIIDLNVRKSYFRMAEYAYQKLNYYDAVFDISERRYSDALNKLSSIRFASTQFLILYVLVFIHVPSRLILKLLRRI